MERITWSNHQKASLSEWQRYFLLLFEKRNEGLEPPFLWLKVAEKSTVVAEAIRKNNFDEAAKALARIFCWLCAFCNANRDLLQENNLKDIVWFKYPKVCYFCAEDYQKAIIDENIKGIQCKCRSHEVEMQKDKHIQDERLKLYRSNLHMPNALDDWVEMFQNIYGHNLHLQSLSSICFHLVEEVGEVFHVLRQYAEFLENIKRDDVNKTLVTRIMGRDRRFSASDIEHMASTEIYNQCLDLIRLSIKEEIADVFSWLCGLVIRLLEIRRCYEKYETRYHNSITKSVEPFVPVDYFEKLPKNPTRPLELSSLLYLEYMDGCPVCRNLKEYPCITQVSEDAARCKCEGKLPQKILQ